MVYRHQRLVRPIGQPFGKIDPDQHGPDQPRRKGYGDRVNVPDRHGSVGKRLRYGRTDVFGMAAACDLGNHPAIERLLLYTGVDYIGN